MEEVLESVAVNGWKLTRLAGSTVTGSTRLKAAEALARFAEAEKFRAAAMLHDEAQHAVPPQLEALEKNPGMRISLRTGRMVSFAATESAAMEIALVSGLSQGQAHRMLEQAETMVMDTPEVLESLSLGRIGTSHVQRILEHAQQIVPDPLPVPRKDADEATREAWERDAAGRAARARAARRDFGADMLKLAPGKSPSQLRTRGRLVLEKYYGFSFTRRSRKALRDRRVFMEEAGDGMSWLSGFLPTAGCQAIFAKVDAMARLLKADPDSAAAVSRAWEAGEADPGEPADDPAEPRTMDQLRTDVFMDMMLNGPAGQGLESVNAEVFVTIPATMLPGMPGGPTTVDGTATDGEPTEISAATGRAAGTGTTADPEASGANIAADASDTNAGVPVADAGAATGEPGGAQGPVVLEGPVVTAGAALGAAELERGAPVPNLLGGGPIDQESALRLMAAAKTWWRVVTDPMTGAVVKFGQDRYRPTAAQRAILQFRDGGCSTPGCCTPGSRCDVDHTHEWQDGGGTDIANCRLGCRKCHRLKSLGLIQVEQRANGTILVTSLFGTRRVSYPAAPWAGDDPTQVAVAENGQETGNVLPPVRSAASGPEAPPPADPDAEIPFVQPEYYLPPRGGWTDANLPPEPAGTRIRA